MPRDLLRARQYRPAVQSVFSLRRCWSIGLCSVDPRQKRARTTGLQHRQRKRANHVRRNGRQKVVTLPLVQMEWWSACSARPFARCSAGSTPSLSTAVTIPLNRTANHTARTGSRSLHAWFSPNPRAIGVAELPIMMSCFLCNPFHTVNRVSVCLT
jgi:hypothetical protein